MATPIVLRALLFMGMAPSERPDGVGANTSRRHIAGKCGLHDTLEEKAMRYWRPLTVVPGAIR
jgi:hypothetical protein